MTEKDIYSNGVVSLEELEDVNYCESFKFKDEWLTDIIQELITKGATKIHLANGNVRKINGDDLNG